MTDKKDDQSKQVRKSTHTFFTDDEYEQHLKKDDRPKPNDGETIQVRPGLGWVLKDQYAYDTTKQTFDQFFYHSFGRHVPKTLSEEERRLRQLILKAFHEIGTDKDSFTQ